MEQINLTVRSSLLVRKLQKKEQQQQPAPAGRSFFLNVNCEYDRKKKSIVYVVLYYYRFSTTGTYISYRPPMFRTPSSTATSRNPLIISESEARRTKDEHTHRTTKNGQRKEDEALNIRQLNILLIIIVLPSHSCHITPGNVPSNVPTRK